MRIGSTPFFIRSNRKRVSNCLDRLFALVAQEWKSVGGAAIVGTGLRPAMLPSLIVPAWGLAVTASGQPLRFS